MLEFTLGPGASPVVEVVTGEVRGPFPLLAVVLVVGVVRCLQLFVLEPVAHLEFRHKVVWFPRGPLTALEIFPQVVIEVVQ